MEPHELAEKLGTSHLHTRTKQEFVKDYRALSNILDISWQVANKVDGGAFEENEHGCVRLFVSADPRFTDQISRIGVNFVDPRGFRIHLGYVQRNSAGGADVFAFRDNTGLHAELILPDDERWEAIVDPIDKAVDKAKTQLLTELAE